MLFLTVTRLMADTYRDWSYHKDFVINTSPTGANVTRNQLRFPLLIRLSAADSTLFNQALSNGADIRFSGVTSNDTIGVHYPYQREFWDKTNRVAVFWVLVDTLKGNSTTQKIRIFSGKSDAGDSSNSSVVFDRQNGFQGVWHFGEGNNSTANDATANGYDGAASGTTPPTDTAGIVGRCRKFDGSSSYFSLNGTAGGNLNFPEGGTYTLSTWVNADALSAANKEIISKGDHQYALKISDGYLWLFTEFNNTAGWQSVSSAAAAGAWHHVVGVRNGANEALYVDGLLASNTISTYGGSGRVTTFDVNIGKWPDNADRFFDGKIDEVEMSNVARDSNWIKLCYQNQRNGSTMISYAPVSGPPASLKYSPNPATYFTGVAVANTPTYTGVVDSFTMSTSTTLSAGLNINKLTGSIYGTPTAAKAQTSYVVYARNAAGFDTETVVITVNGPPSNLNYTYDTVSYTVNTAIPSNTPSYTGVVDSFSATLPAGLQIAKTTGIISGTPITITPAANYTITARNPAGTATVALNITISTAVIAPSNLNYRSNPLPCVIGTPIPPDSPTVTGTVTSWSISSSFASTGLSFNTSNGIISGVPTAQSSATPYIITAGNSAGSTRDTVTVTVNQAVVAPSISAQSGNVWAGVNSIAARVWVKAAGTTPLTYQWSKNGTSIATGTKDTLKLDTVKRTDNNSIYVCSVSNSANTISSVPCTLHVVAANFSAKPVTGNDTLTVTFVDSSLGNSAAFPLKYSWSFGDGATDSTANPPPHFYQTPAPTAYTAKLIVTANGVSDSMKKAITIAALQLKAGFKRDTSYTTAPSSLTVTFTDTSSGTIYYRTWSFGDGTSKTDSSRASVVHTYSNIGSDTVTLTVRGPAGSNTKIWTDCITIFSSAGNPIIITGQYSASKTIAITFSNYSNNLHDTFPPPYVNKIELWSKKNALPTEADTVGASPLASYILSQMKAAGTRFSDTIQLTGTYAATDSLGLMAAILWNTGNRSAFLRQNGTYIPLRDTAHPVNKLAISGHYTHDSLADIYLDNVSSLDPTKDAFVEVQYDFIDSINFSNNPSLEIPVATVLAQAINGRYTARISNPLIAGAQRTLYCGVSIKGVNNLLSKRNTASFSVGGIRPGNPIRLQASNLSAGSIQLQWTPAPNIDSIRIWYSSLQQVPLSYDISETEFQKKYVSTTATSDVINGLDPNTTYYFGAQVDSNNLWSSVTDSSRASAKTDSASGPPVQNTVHLDTVYFDTSTNSIKAVITTDTTGHYGDTLVAGMSWSTDITAIDTGSHPPVNAITLHPLRPLDTVTASLGDQVQFDTLYYVGVWLRTLNTSWAKPVSDSKGSLVTPAFTWQKVTYGGKVPIVYADNKIFQIRIDTSMYPGITDDNKIILWQPSDAPKGFIPVSIGFEFSKKIPPPLLYIGIKFGALPDKFTPFDVKIYRYENGLWILDRSPINYDNGYVSVYTRDISFPFIAMIDTMAPSVTPLSRWKDSVVALMDVSDTFAIRDNIANLKWRFQAAKGGDAYDISSPTPQDTGTFNAYSDTVNSLIEAGLVSADQGVRALLIVEDGEHVDTFNVSRRVIRANNSDVVTTDTMKWTPLRVTAQPDSPGVPSALRAAADSVWKYDITQFRLFRWYSYSGNAMNDTNKWVEYSGAPDSLFSFVPGRVEWIKTRKSVRIDFGRSITPDLTRCVTVPLPPGTWSDIALPYKFNIKLGDIFDATGGQRPLLDSLHIITWNREGDTGKYQASEVFFSALGIGEPSIPLLTLKNTSVPVAYSVYNPWTVPINLVVPPLPEAMSKYTAVHKKTDVKPMVLKVSGRMLGGTTLAPVYCGYCPGGQSKRFFPAAPALDEAAAIRVCDERKRMFGYVVQTGMLDKDGGVAYDLAFNNLSGRSERIQCTVEAINGMPNGMRLAMFDPSSGLFTDAKAAISVAIDAKGSVFRQLVMGTDSYLAKVKMQAQLLRLALVNVYPNPFKRSMRIRFSIPQSGLSKVHFGIFDACGREVWNASFACAGKSGLQEVAWNGNTKSKAPAASGMYIVRMTALNAKGAPSGVFEKKIMYLP